MNEGKVIIIVYCEKLKFIREFINIFLKRGGLCVIRKIDIKLFYEFREGKDYFYLERFRKGLWRGDCVNWRKVGFGECLE